MSSAEAQFMLVETKKLVIRKENMRRNRTTNKAIVCSVRERRKLPTFEPDFGMKSNKLYIFNCSIFALDIITNKLNIKL